MQRSRRKNRESERGNAFVEFALILPLICIILLCTFNAGLYMYAFISVQSAASAAAMRNAGGRESSVDQSIACSMATSQLRGLPAIGAYSGSCSSAPLVVTSVLCTGPGACGGSIGSADGKPSALVTVRYTLPALFRAPLLGPSVVQARSQMKLRNVE